MRSDVCAGALVISLLAGCANLTVTKISDGTRPQVGQLIYYLPRTAIITNVTLTLTKCSVTPTKLNGRAANAYEFNVTEDVTPTISVEADPAFQYGISMDEARSWFKEINFTLATNSNGTFQSFNGQINDQAGPIGIAAVTAAVKIVGAALIPGVSTVDAKNVQMYMAVDQKKPAKLVSLCDAKYTKALANIDAAQKALDDAKNKKVSGKYTQDQKDTDVAAKQATLMKVSAGNGLQRTVAIRWLPMASEVRKSDFDPVLDKDNDLDPVLANWLSPQGRQWFEHGDRGDEKWQSVFGDASKHLHLNILVKRFTIGNSGDYQTSADGKTKFPLADPGGLILRQPALGMLRVCKGECTAFREEAVVDLTNDIVAAQQIALPQLGQIRVFPERSAFFENATLAVSVNPDGSLASIANHSVSTAASGLAGLSTAGDAASTALVTRNTATTAANAADAAKAANADTLNKAHADCLTQKAVIEAAGEKAVPCQ